MESIGYIINRNFILIAVDTNYEIQLDDKTFHVGNLRKVYKLNGANIISVVGNPYRYTEIIKYILKLNELGYNNNFDQIKEDLNDTFNNSQTNVIDTVKNLAEILPNFYDEKGYVKLNELSAVLKNNPDSLNILNEAIKSMQNSTAALAQIFVFGWEKDLSKIRMVHYLSLGQNLTGEEFLDYQPDILYLRFISATNPAEVTVSLEKELVQAFNTECMPGWDNDPESVSKIIEKGKMILAEGLEKISPYNLKPNIIFYELSCRTGFEFEEPDISLVNLSVER